MAKKTKQEPGNESLYDAELEQHVDEMLAPEPRNSNKTAKVNKPDKPAATKIAIMHHGEEVTKSAPELAPEVQDEPVVSKSAPFKISITHDDEPAPDAAPIVPADDSAAEEPLATAPLLPDTEVIEKPRKKIAIQHDIPEESPVAESEAIEAEPLSVPGLPIAEAEAEADAAAAAEEPVLNKSEPIKITERPTPIPDALPEFIKTDEPAPELPDALDDERTERLVNDIIAKEGDEILAAEDERKRRFTPPSRPSFGERLGSFFGGWWHNAFTRWLTILFVLAVIGAAFGMPSSRYTVLNAVGVRSGASVTVLDNSTQQPLKNVTVKLADKTTQTDENGVAHFTEMKLGLTQLVIQKRAFAQINKSVTIGWGSNPLTGFELLPAGSQYSFIVTDFLTGKPVGGAMAASEYADANADDKGVIKLTLDSNAKETFDVTISSKGYRDEHVTLNTESKQQIPVQMAIARKHAYVSNRSGKYDIYKIDIDGKNDEVALAGTGTERPDMVVVPDPDQNVIAVVSTREPERNKDGYLLSTLTIVNLDAGTTVKVTQSEQINIVGWSGGRLAYVQIASGASAANPDRQRLMSYDYAKRDNKQLASANYFNDVLSVGSNIYYAPTGGSSEPAGNFIRIKYDGSEKKVILVGETWNALRTDYEHVVLAVPGAWYEHVITSATATKLDGQPANTVSRIYVDSPDGKHSLWLDKRDGKGVLLNYDIAAKKDAVLLTKSGLSYPVRWLDNSTIVYRIKTSDETADYVMSLNGGEPHKIHDVTATGSNDQWYYYN